MTLSGYSGKRLDISLPTTLDPGTCDVTTIAQTPAYFVFGASDPDGNDPFAQGPARPGISGSSTSRARGS